MNNKLEMAPEFTESVINHMNGDHADACLCIVKAFSAMESASNALLNGLDWQSLYFTVSSQTSDQQFETVDIKIDFPNPLSDESQVRAALVEMTKSARKLLENRP